MIVGVFCFKHTQQTSLEETIMYNTIMLFWLDSWLIREKLSPTFKYSSNACTDVFALDFPHDVISLEIAKQLFIVILHGC